LSNSRLPNFFIVGAPKAGTTSLYHYLDQHPEIYMSPVKEPNYFASEIQLEGFAEPLREPMRRRMADMQRYLAGSMEEKRFGAVGLEWVGYLKLFRNVRQEKAIGEASVCYLWSESAARNIFARIPEAKIIMILRDPAERALSQYRQWAGKEQMRETFRDVCEKSIANQGGKFQAMSPFLEMGLYAEQVKRYFDLFPRENIRVDFYENYRRDPAGMIAETLRFLGVDASFQPDMSRRHLEGNRASCAMDFRERAYLTAFYRDDVRKLAQLLDCDLSRWES
jgi:hypothetical protein